jgi:hypothetical protein
MTTKQIFDMLKKDNQYVKEQSGHDTHDWEGAEQLSDEEVKETAKQIDQALRQGHAFFDTIKQAASMLKLDPELAEWSMRELNTAIQEAEEQKPNGSISSYRLRDYKKVVKKSMQIDQELPKEVEDFLTGIQNRTLGVVPVSVYDISGYN